MALPVSDDPAGSASGRNLLGLDQAKQVGALAEAPVKDLPRRIQQGVDQGIGRVIANRRARSLGNHDASTAQDGELLGDGGTRNAGQLLDLADTARTLAEVLQDRDSHGVGEALEELGLEGAQSIGVVLAGRSG